MRPPRSDGRLVVLAQGELQLVQIIEELAAIATAEDEDLPVADDGGGVPGAPCRRVSGALQLVPPFAGAVDARHLPLPARLVGLDTSHEEDPLPDSHCRMAHAR